MRITSNHSMPGKSVRRIALEEHFVLNEPEHIDRWLTVIPTFRQRHGKRFYPFLRILASDAWKRCRRRTSTSRCFLMLAPCRGFSIPRQPSDASSK
jgi:hypothetical protein